MSEINHYLEAIENIWNPIYGISNDESLRNNTLLYNGNKKQLEETDCNIVLIGVPEDRNSADINQCSKSPDEIRKILYGLRGLRGIKLLDAGNIRGKKVNDRYNALKETAKWFLNKNKILIILGGTQELTVPVFEYLASIKNKVNLTVCDAMIDLDFSRKDFSSRAWLQIITENYKKSLEDLTIMGVQNYLITEQLENYINKEYHDIIRLSDIRGANMNKSEVPLRDSDIISLDFRTIVGKNTFSENIVSPHGIEPYEACKLCHYAGLSEKLSVMGLFETTIDNKTENAPNAALAAQMLWHFMDGVAGRNYDFPSENSIIYKNYMVFLESVGKEIRFHNNSANGRWWMEVPADEGENKIFSCNHEEYLIAMDNELPDKWWRLFMKNRKL